MDKTKDTGRLISTIIDLITLNKDKLIDVLLDEYHLKKMLERYFEGYEILFIPKNRGK